MRQLWVRALAAVLAGLLVGGQAQAQVQTQPRLPFQFQAQSPSQSSGQSPGQSPGQSRAGEVESLRGVVVAQAPGEPPRSLARGDTLREGDQLQSAPSSSAVLRLDDGSRLTLRPDTRLVLRTWRYQPQAPGEEPAPDNRLVVDLLRGGLRAVAGLVTRSGPDAARIQTPVAAIGIRGTDLYARLCRGEADCLPPRSGTAAAPDGSAAARRAAGSAAPPTSARVVSLEGRAEAIDPLERRRRLLPGASLYPGDRIVTAPASHLVMAFRDDARLTLGAASELRIDDYRYDEEAPQEGRMLLSVVRGTLRALTGLIARADPRHVTVTTPTATLGIRGTGFDLACLGACAEGRRAPAEEDWLRVCTWRGAVDLRPPDEAVSEPVVEDRCAALAVAGVQPLTTPLVLEGPRPDSVTVPASLFSRMPLPATLEGLLVYVEVGSVRLSGAAGERDLGNGEAGLADASRVERLADISWAREQWQTGLGSLLGTSGLSAMCRR